MHPRQSKKSNFFLETGCFLLDEESGNVGVVNLAGLACVVEDDD